MSGPATVHAIRGPAVTTTVTIASGTSLSAAVDLLNYRLARIVMPAGWDAADITLQASADGTTFGNVYDAAGTEYNIKAAASRQILIDVAALQSIRHLKVRSGTAGAAVNQTADRTLTLVLIP